MFVVTLLLRHPFRQPIRLGKFITVFSCRHKGHLCGGYISYESIEAQTGWRAPSPLPPTSSQPHSPAAHPPNRVAPGPARQGAT
ncbi:MAG: hypothetical protein RLZZ117_890 [Cyanobacteriota bacterium]